MRRDAELPGRADMPIADRQVTVLHSIGAWLEQTQTWIYSQVACLPSFVESHIACCHTRNLEQFYVPNIHSLDQGPRWRSVWDRGLRRLGVRHHLEFLASEARRNRVDLLHSHFGTQGWGDIEVARRLKLKHAVTFYGFDVNYMPKSEAKWYARYAELFEHVDLVLCEGPYMARSIEALGCPSSKVRVNHLGVMLDRIAFKPRVWTPGEPLRVLIAASFTEKKGVPYALAALGRFQHYLDIEITVIGDAKPDAPNDLSEKQRILDAIKEQRLEGKLRLLGYQPHATLLQEAYKHHVYLSPSVTAATGDTEGGAPVSIIEMAATGMPVISTLHCDIPSVIGHGTTGLLSPERDVESLVAHLKWLVENPQRWSSMVNAARAHLEREFSAQDQGKRLGALYREVMVAA